MILHPAVYHSYPLQILKNGEVPEQPAAVKSFHFSESTDFYRTEIYRYKLSDLLTGSNQLPNIEQIVAFAAGRESKFRLKVKLSRLVVAVRFKFRRKFVFPVRLSLIMLIAFGQALSDDKCLNELLVESLSKVLYSILSSIHGRV